MLSAPAAAEKSCVEGDPTNCRQTVKAGEVVPFDGELMTPRRAAKLAVQAGQCGERIAAEVAEAVSLVNIDLKSEKRQRENDNESCKEQKEFLEKQLDTAIQAAGPSFWENPTLWFFIGVATTALMVGLTVAILDATRPEVVTVPVTTDSSSALTISW